MDQTPPSTPQIGAPIPKRVICLIGASFVVLAIAILAIQLVWARYHLLQGASSLNAALGAVKSPAALQSTVTFDMARVHLEEAQTSFARANSDLDLASPLLPVLSSLPRFGPVVKAAPAISDAGYYATTGALNLVEGALPLWATLGQSHTGSPLAKISATLPSGSPEFAAAESNAAKALQQLNTVPPDLKYGSVRSDLSKLRRDLPKLETAGEWLQLLPQVLGQFGRERYLFCWENSAEIRPTGGFIGAVDLLTARKGQITRHFSGSIIEGKHPAKVPLPVPEALTTHETTWIFRDSNVSPNFPLTARLERWFYHRDTRSPVDGVVDFLDQGVPELLTATGPIHLKAYNVTLTARNAQALANRFASAAPHPRGPETLKEAGSLDTFRKQFLGFEFAAIIRRLESLPVSRWGTLAQAISQMVQQKDILLWSPSTHVERAIEASNASGTLKYVPGDFLDVVDDNRSYNKIGPYIHETASYSADLVPHDWIDSTLTIRYHLTRSPSWVEGVGPGLGALGSKHEFRDFIRVFVPPGAVVQSVPGLKQAAPYGFVGRSLSGQTAYGLTQIAGWFTMRPNTTKTLRISYATPANDLAYDHFRQYRLTVIHQPGSRLQGVAVHVTGIGSLKIGRKGHGYASFLKLSSNRTVQMAIRGESAPNLLTLTPPSRSDPFIPLSDLAGFSKR